MKCAWFHPQDSLLGSTGHGAESSACLKAHRWSDCHRGVSNGGLRGQPLPWVGVLRHLARQRGWSFFKGSTCLFQQQHLHSLAPLTVWRAHGAWRRPS